MDISALRAKRELVVGTAARHGARNVRVFGSVARGDATPGSDVDLLVDFLPGRSLLDQVAPIQDLGELLGCPVDVVVEGGLSPYLEGDILREARAL